VKALEVGIPMAMMTLAIVAFDNGRCKGLVKYPMDFPIHVMQVAEDLQLIVGHIVMRHLHNHVGNLAGQCCVELR